MHMMLSVITKLLLIVTSINASAPLTTIKIETVLPIVQATQNSGENKFSFVKRETNTEVMSNLLAGYSDMAIINIDQLASLVKATYGQDDLMGKVKEHKYFLVSKTTHKSSIKKIGFLKGHFEEYILNLEPKLTGIELTMAEKKLWMENKLNKNIDAIILSEEFLDLSMNLKIREIKKNNWYIVANGSVKSVFLMSEFKQFLKVNGFDYKMLNKGDVAIIEKQMEFYFNKKSQKEKAELKLRLLLDDLPEGY